MNNNYNNCKENTNECRTDCYTDNNSECNKYKQKSDELYIKAQCIQEESKRLICEAKELEHQAKELERKAKELCSNANIAWEQAINLEAESNNLLDLASFYCHKASECYKNLNSSYKYKPTCGTYSNTCGCKKY